MDLAGERLYYVQGSCDVWRANLDGSDPVRIRSGDCYGAYGLNYDVFNHRLGLISPWDLTYHYTILLFDYVGREQDRFDVGPTFPQMPVFDTGHTYLPVSYRDDLCRFDHETGEVVCIDLEESPTEWTSYAFDLDLDTGMLYAVSRELNKIYRFDTNGANQKCFWNLKAHWF